MIKKILNEATEKRIDQIASRGDLENLKFLAFDSETTGLHYYQGKYRSLRLKLSEPIKKELDDFYAQKFHTDKKAAHQLTAHFHSPHAKLQLAELAAIVFDINGTVIDEFHQYVAFDESMASDKVMRLIHWNDDKKNVARKPYDVMKDFHRFMRKHEGAIMLAHNAPYDMSIIMALSKRFKILDLVTYLKNKSTVIVDTRKTTKVRELLKDILPTKTKVDKDGNEKTREDNVQGSIIKALGIENKEAHTAIEDVRSLMKMFIKIVKEYKTKLSGN